MYMGLTMLERMKYIYAAKPKVPKPIFLRLRLLLKSQKYTLISIHAEKMGEKSVGSMKIEYFQ